MPETAERTMRCEDCGGSLPEAVREGDGWVRKSFIYEDSATRQYRSVCETCFNRHYCTYEIVTYCPNCCHTAVAFYRMDFQEAVIGCLRCNKRLQRITMRDYVHLSDEQHATIAKMMFDYWDV